MFILIYYVYIGNNVLANKIIFNKYSYIVIYIYIYILTIYSYI